MPKIKTQPSKAQPSKSVIISFSAPTGGSTYAAYASASDVANRCRNLLGGVSNFSSSTSPTITAVNGFLSSACSIIETFLLSCGYSVPVTEDTAVYGWLSELNTLYAAAQAEMTRVNVTLGPGERTRGQVFDEMFWKGLKRLAEGDLTFAGLSRTSTAKIYVGGVSQDDKDTWEDTTDRVRPRFTRGMFAFDETVRPDYSTSGS